MNWKGFGGKRDRGLFEVLSRHLPGTGENHESLSRYSRCPDQALPEYKYRALLLHEPARWKGMYYERAPKDAPRRFLRGFSINV
jgi:hypothetical protein